MDLAVIFSGRKEYTGKDPLKIRHLQQHYMYVCWSKKAKIKRRYLVGLVWRTERGWLGSVEDPDSEDHECVWCCHVVPLFRFFFFSLAAFLLRRLLLSRGQTMKVAVIQQQFNRRAPFTVGRVLQDSHSQDKRVLPGGRRGGVKREMVKEKLRTNIVTDEYVKSKICNKSTAKAQNKKRLAVTACLAQSVERKTFNLVVVSFHHRLYMTCTCMCVYHGGTA